MDPPERRLNPNPQTEANWLSRASFWWTNSIFRRSQERRLEDVDLYDALPADSSVTLSNNLGREWEKEVYKSKTGGRPSLKAALYRCYYRQILSIGAVFFIVEGLRIAEAIFLGLIVTYFEPTSNMSRMNAYIFSAAWTISYTLIIFLDNFAFHQSYYYGLRMRVASTSLIYRKLLRLSHQSLRSVSSGTIVNLLSTDAHKFDQSCLGINYIWIAPLETVVIVVLLWTHLELGATSLIGLAVLAIISPVQLLMGKFMSKLRSRVSHLSDRRVRVMTEIISGIRDIKLNCWEKAFSSLVNTIRKSEWTYIRVMAHVTSINSAMYYVSGKLLLFVTFMTYTLLGGQSGASVVFSSLALFEILRTSVSLLLPWGIQHYIEAKSAIDRIQTYLLLEEKILVNITCQTTANNSLIKRSPLPENVVIKFENFSAAWEKGEKSFALENINLSIQKGQYVVLTGAVSSGKSSLLLAITGELSRLGGFVRAQGKVGLVSQLPWIYPGTIRDNILYGEDMDRRKYNRVMHACALLQDMETFDNADLSTVGEKGVKLTIGQKSKICLARAVYQNCDIYLVDDIFSHMEDSVAIHIFTKCFCGILSTKTIILVSENLKFVKAADEIVVLDEGKIAHVGNYDDIQNQGVEMEKILYSYQYYQESNQDDGDNKKCDIYASQTSIVRQRSGLDSSYGSSESLDQVILEYDQGCSDTDILEDEAETASVSGGLYISYLTKGCGLCCLLFFLLVCSISQVSYVLCDWWLYKWVTEQRNVTSRDSQTTSSDADSAEVFPSPIPHIFPFTVRTINPVVDFYVYLGVFLAFLLSGFIRSVVFGAMTSQVAKSLHQLLFNTILRAPLSFFAKHDSGNITCRFARDIGYLDDSLPASYFDCVQFMFVLVGTCAVTAVTSYWLLLVVVPMLVLFLCARYFFLKTAREVKRLEMAAKMPVYKHLSSTVEGIWIIRAFDSDGRFLRNYDTYQDRHTAACYMYLAVKQWFALRLDAISVISAALVVFVCVANSQMVDPGLMGMTLAYALNTMGLFQYSATQSAQLEHQMSGLEQVCRYTEVKSEGHRVTETRPSPSWPQYGIVTFEGYTVSGPDGCKHLRNMWGCIRAEEKVGIVSRTEGSKSAIVSAILRLVEPSHGILRIDGQDISELGLQDIRERITVIPPDPVLFGGSLRRNLDPFTRYPDVSLWKVLEEVSLKRKVERLPGMLYADMTEHREAYSLGERQLLGLARALLQGSKIVIYEESSSVIDKHTESVIQYVISNKFNHKTLIVIGQRIHTVITMDRVMVLDEGKIKDFDPPHQMLQNKFGCFHRLVSNLTHHEVSILKKLAKDKFENRPYRPPPHLETGEGVSYSGRVARHFLPSFQSTRLTGVFSHFTGNRFSTNRF